MRPPILHPAGKVVAAVSLLILAAVVWKGIAVYQAATRLERDSRHLVALGKQLQQNPSVQLIEEVRGAALDTATSLSRVRAELSPLEPVLRLSGALPEDWRWPADVPDLLAFSEPLAQAGAWFVRGIEPTDAPLDNLPLWLLSSVSRAGPRVMEVEPRLAAAEAAFSSLKGRALNGPLEQYSDQIQQVGRALPQVRQNLGLLQSLGPALGFDRPHTYLLLGQNNHEIRATGGFIGTAGVLTLRNGSIEELKYGSSYTLDDKVAPLQPPYPLARYLGLGGWYLRDSNWWPDFPSSAAQAELAWTRAGNPPVDGIIAFDTEAMKMLLGLAGGVEVPGVGVVNSDNYERVAAEQFYSQTALTNQQTFDSAKNSFLSTMGPLLIHKIMGMKPGQILPMAEQASRLLDERHVQMVFKDQRLTSAMHANGWDGSLTADEKNPLLVVDTTMCYGDTYAFITPEAKIAVQERPDGSQEHEVVLHYINNYPQGLPPWASPKMVGSTVFDPSTGRSNDVPGFWADWLRVYLPSTAREVSVSGLTDQLPLELESGRIMVSGYFQLPAGASWQVRVRYVIRQGSAQSGEGPADYALLWQKQAGLDARPLSLTVQWSNGARTSVETDARADSRVSVPRPRD